MNHMLPNRLGSRSFCGPRCKLLNGAKVVLCCLLILNLHIAGMGCQPTALSPNALPADLLESIRSLLEGTAFEGATSLQIDSANQQVQLVFPDQERLLSFAFAATRGSLVISTVRARTLSGAVTIHLDASQHVTAVDTSDGLHWIRPRNWSSYTPPSGSDEQNSYALANMELLALAQQLDGERDVHPTVTSPSQTGSELDEGGTATPGLSKNKHNSLSSVLGVFAVLAAIIGLSYSISGAWAIIFAVLSLMNGMSPFYENSGDLYNVGNGSDRVVLMDVNGDGVSDAAVLNRTTSDVSILLGQGDGTFVDAATYATLDEPEWLETGDWDDDGDIDLAVSSTFGGIVVQLNDGTGVFGEPSPLPYDAVASFVAGDVNQDGRVDLVAYHTWTPPSIAVYINHGSEFAEPHDFPVANDSPGSPIGIRQLALGDFDQDGDVDIAVTNWSTQEVGLLLNNGAGSFAPPKNTLVSRGAQYITAFDADGDGDLDIATVGTSPSWFSSIVFDQNPGISLLRNQGDASFIVEEIANSTHGASDITFNDFDGDGDLDLVLSSGGSPERAATIIVNNGSGAFGEIQWVPSPEGASMHVEGADLDQDGDTDLVVVGLYMTTPDTLHLDSQGFVAVLKNKIMP